MKKSILFSAAAALVMGAALATPSLAATPGAECTQFVFHPDFLKNYSYAPAACQDVMVKNGKKSMKFAARVVGVKGNDVQLEFLNVRNESIQGGKVITLSPRPDVKVSVNGKATAVKDLKKGDTLHVYMPEGRLGLSMDPDDPNVSDIH